MNGNPVTSGSPSGPISLSVGANVITTVVTARGYDHDQDLHAHRDARSASTNADLSNLVPSAGTLTPAFASGTISYTATRALRDHQHHRDAHGGGRPARRSR